ncbi:MAG TPA: hypothetical protein VIS03_01460 [Kiloniellaceae bacterium]
MSLRLTKITVAAAVAAFVALTAVAETVDAKDWRRTVDNHYDAVEEAKYVPRGDNPQWNFTLDTVMSEMAWRQRTARMLRDAPRPSAAPTDGLAPQLADRPEPPTFRFSF